MQARLTIVSALAALALAASARAADEKTKDAKEPSEQASGTATSEQGGTAAGSEGGAEAAQAGADQPQQEIVGRVAKIDKGAVTVQASPLSDPHELTLTEETKVMSGGSDVSVDRIKEGDMVRAVFVGDAKASGKATSGKATEINLIKTQATEGGAQQK
jgi:hypothetical protein